ncbi:hypothetical protein FRX31_025091, partial [Thalictrum thalictroides]
MQNELIVAVLPYAGHIIDAAQAAGTSSAFGSFTIADIDREILRNEELNRVSQENWLPARYGSKKKQSEEQTTMQ